jgi:hypothetical protein
MDFDAANAKYLPAICIASLPAVYICASPQGAQQLKNKSILYCVAPVYFVQLEILPRCKPERIKHAATRRPCVSRPPHRVPGTFAYAQVPYVLCTQGER